MSDIKPTFEGELMLAGWSETHNGGAKVTFWLSDAADLDVFRSMTVKKGNTAGQRFAAVLVEIGEDEQPVEKIPNSESSRAYIAVRMCASCDFQSFCISSIPPSELETMANLSMEAIAARYVIKYCGIQSRAELDTNDEAAGKWIILLQNYRSWMMQSGGYTTR